MDECAEAGGEAEFDQGPFEISISACGIKGSLWDAGVGGWLSVVMCRSVGRHV